MPDPDAAMTLATTITTDTQRPLPDGWRWARLGDVADAVRGVTFSSGESQQQPFDGSVACLTTSGVQSEVKWSSRYFIPEERLSSENQKLRINDLLVSTANSKTLVGKTCRVTEIPFECVFGAFVTVVRSSADADAAFLGYWLRSATALDYCYTMSSNTTGISNLRVSDLLALPIPLPPLDEQRRIAAILAERMAAVERARAAAEAQLAAAKALPAAELRAIFESEEAQAWPRVRLGDVADCCSGSTPSRTRADYYGGDIPWVKTGELKDSKIERTEEAVTEAALRDTSLRILPPGTLLIAMYGQGQTRGRTGILAVSATTNQACFAILPNPSEFTPEFVQFWLRHSYERLRNESEGRGGNQPNLNGEILKAQALPLPALQEQQHIAATLAARMADIAQLRATLEAQLDTINALPAALLRQAFSGEL